MRLLGLTGTIEFPEFPEEALDSCVAIYVGGCTDRGVGSRFRARAHAHNYSEHRDFGQICILSCRRLFTSSGGWSQIMLHEFAHILVPNQGHTDKWRTAARALGYRLPAHYKKKKKRPVRYVNVHDHCAGEPCNSNCEMRKA